MDSIFGVGLPELILLVVLAGMLMGPERIVRYARMLGLMTARLQAVSRAFLRQMSAELDSVDSSGELRETLDELQLLRRQVAELRSEVLTITGSTAAEGRKAVGELRDAQNSIMPASLLASARKTSATPAEPPVGGVYRPPNLFPEASEVPPPNGASSGSASRLPRRVDILDDPD